MAILNAVIYELRFYGLTSLQLIVTIIVLLQGFLIVAGCVFLTFFIPLRAQWRLGNERLRRFYFDKMVDDLISFNQTQSRMALRVPWTHRTVVRNLLIDQIVSIQGRERKFFSRWYVALGFLRSDVAAARSPFWWIRLSAIGRLETLDLRLLNSFFWRQSHDRNALVAMTSLRGWARFTRDAQLDTVVGKFEKWTSNYRHFVLEIVSNLGLNLGPSVISAILSKTRNEHLQEACAFTLGLLPSPEAISSLTRLTQSSPAPGIVRQSLRGLRRIGDPDALATVRQQLSHLHPDVRAEALRTMIALGGDQPSDYKTLAKDTSPEVQRALRGVTKNKEPT